MIILSMTKIAIKIEYIMINNEYPSSKPAIIILRKLFLALKIRII